MGPSWIALLCLPAAGLLWAGGPPSPPAPTGPEAEERAVRQTIAWIGQCVDDLPLGVMVSLGLGESDWDAACLELKEPCRVVLSSPAQRRGAPRCRRLCEEGRSASSLDRAPAANSIPGGQPGRSASGLDRAPAASCDDADLPPPPARVGLPARPPDVDARTNDAIRSMVHWAAGARFNDRRETMCLAFSHANQEYKKRLDDMALRNAEHYLWAYCDVLEAVWSRGWSLVACDLAAGYSAVKLLGPLRDLVSTSEDGRPASRPSLDEIYWGCAGALDAADGRLP
ncbi:MAG: hypothetical protein HY927_14630 [Elusimicrobia bacterium]|nr:hypothetical protein [Elusimicrobiota bacterium]